MLIGWLPGGSAVPEIPTGFGNWFNILDKNLEN